MVYRFSGIFIAAWTVGCFWTTDSVEMFVQPNLSSAQLHYEWCLTLWEWFYKHHPFLWRYQLVNSTHMAAVGRGLPATCPASLDFWLTLVVGWIHSQGGISSRTWVGPWGDSSFQQLHFLWVHWPCHLVRSLGVLAPSGFVSLLHFLIWL